MIELSKNALEARLGLTRRGWFMRVDLAETLVRAIGQVAAQERVDDD